MYFWWSSCTFSYIFFFFNRSLKRGLGTSGGVHAPLVTFYFIFNRSLKRGLGTSGGVHVPLVTFLYFYIFNRSLKRGLGTSGEFMYL